MQVQYFLKNALLILFVAIVSVSLGYMQGHSSAQNVAAPSLADAKKESATCKPQKSPTPQEKQRFPNCEQPQSIGWVGGKGAAAQTCTIDWSSGKVRGGGTSCECAPQLPPGCHTITTESGKGGDFKCHTAIQCDPTQKSGNKKDQQGGGQGGGKGEEKPGGDKGGPTPKLPELPQPKPKEPGQPKPPEDKKEEEKDVLDDAFAEPEDGDEADEDDTAEDETTEAEPVEEETDGSVAPFPASVGDDNPTDGDGLRNAFGKVDSGVVGNPTGRTFAQAIAERAPESVKNVFTGIGGNSLINQAGQAPQNVPIVGTGNGESFDQDTAPAFSSIAPVTTAITERVNTLSQQVYGLVNTLGSFMGGFFSR